MSDTPVQLDTLRQGEPGSTVADVVKLTDWASEPTLADLSGDIEGCRPTQQAQVQKIRRWLDNLNVEGSAKFKAKRGRSSVQPKLIRKQAEWRYSNLSEPFLSSEDPFTVKPSTFEDTKAALQNQTVLNWQFRTKLNRVQFVDEFVRTVVDEGTCIIQTGWIREEKLETVQAPIYDFYPVTTPEDMAQLQQDLAIKQGNPAGFDQLPEDRQQAANYSLANQQPVIARLAGYQEVQKTTLTKNEPTLDIRNTANVFIDPSCGGDLKKAMFIAHTFETSYGELKRDKRYKNLEKIDWDSRSILDKPDNAVSNTPPEFNFKDKARKKIWAYEYWGYWDINDDGVLVPFVATWVGSTLIRLEKSPFYCLPWIIARYMPIKKSVYGEPDGELLEDNQKIKGAVTRGMIDLMARSANGQTGMAKQMLDVANRRKFDNGDDYEFNPNQNPQQGIIEHKFPEIPNSAPLMLQMQDVEAESLTGVKAFGQGLTGAAFGDTAKGAQGVMDAAAKREMGILRRLAEAMALIGEHFIAMNQEFLSEEEVVRLTNETFEVIRRDDLQGKFDNRVEVATDESNNARANDLSFMLQTVGNNLDFEMVRLLLIEIARLRKMPELAKKLEQFQPKPDPMVQQKLQLEIAELNAKIEKLKAETIESQAKAELAQAQAGLSHSKKDNENLKFVEQEGGTTHARDMEKQRSQAEANQDLVVTKAIVDRHKDVEGPTPDKDITTAVGFNQISRG
jgi:hypothetical protein